MKNKMNIWHFTWIVGIYAILVTILILTIQYKVKWENKDLNTYLYFYNCSGHICTTNEKIDNYDSHFRCEKKVCPYVKERQDDLFVLTTGEKDYLFDYKNDKTISDEYINYSIMNDGVVVKDNSGKYGIIDFAGQVLIAPYYNKIVDYKNGYLAYAENGKIGIINSEKNININPTYEGVRMISDNKYAYLEDGKYYIASYDTELPINNLSYDYVYPIDDIILTFKDRKLDILSDNMESKLLLKIDTTYTYTEEKERDSLRIYREGNLLHFSIGNTDNSVDYIFDLKNKKLFY